MRKFRGFDDDEFYEREEKRHADKNRRARRRLKGAAQGSAIEDNDEFIMDSIDLDEWSK